MKTDTILKKVKETLRDNWLEILQIGRAHV